MKFHTKIIAASSAVLLAGGIGTAYAAIPDSDDDEFHACVDNSGTLRETDIIDHEAGVTCPSGTTRKTWQQAPLVRLVRVEQEVPCVDGNVAEGIVDIPSGMRIIEVRGTKGGLEDQGPMFLANATHILGQESASDVNDLWDVGSQMPKVTVGAQGRVDGVHVVVSDNTASQTDCTTTLLATVDMIVYDV